MLGVALATLIFSCKSVRSSSSDVKAWELDGSRQAAKTYIVRTISTYYPDIAKGEPVLSQFADALQNEKTEQTESADYVLHELWLQSQEPASPETLSPIDAYIVQEWISHTNYLLVRAQAAPKLEYIAD